MANKLVQYGAVVAGAAALPAIAKGVSAATSSLSISSSLNSIGIGAEIGYGEMVGFAAVDAGKAFSSQLSSTFQNPAFLTSVGLGLAGALLGSGSKRPTLSLPNIAATAAVALSVGSLLKQGRAALETAERGKGGGTITAPISFNTSQASTVGEIVATERQKGTTTTYRFPLNSNEMYWIKFSIRPYSRNAVDNSNKAGNFHTIIKLPLPSNIVDAVKLMYQDLSLGMFGGPGLSALNKTVDAFKGAGGFKGGGGAYGAASRAAVVSMSEMLGDEGFVYAVGRRMLQGTGTFGSAMDMISGNAPNPHMAVTFQGVNLKKHQFTWRMSPDNLQESKQLEQIIRQVQAAALPAKDGVFMLKFPDVVEVSMSPSNMMQFLPCSIDFVAVNYAPNGVPSFFRPPAGSQNSASLETDAGTLERYPTEVEFTITLRELDIHTSDMSIYAAAKQGQNTVNPPEAPTSETVKPSVPKDLENWNG